MFALVIQECYSLSYYIIIIILKFTEKKFSVIHILCSLIFSALLLIFSVIFTYGLPRCSAKSLSLLCWCWDYFVFVFVFPDRDQSGCLPRVPRSGKTRGNSRHENRRQIRSAPSTTSSSVGYKQFNQETKVIFWSLCFCQIWK